MPSIDVASAIHKARHATGGPDALTPADIGAVPASRWLTGTGSPEGVTAAPVGTEYTDTAGTTGAWKWLKKAGTGTTGWVVTEGSTGWVNAAALLSADLKLSTTPSTYQHLKIRRTVGMVNVSALVNTIAATSSLFGGPLPSGWRFDPSTPIQRGVHILTSGSVDSVIPSIFHGGGYIGSSGSAVRLTVSAGSTVAVTVSAPADTAWPTTLTF